MAEPTKQKQAAEPETGTETVTVGLKHPTGIVIEAFRETEEMEPSPMGMRKVKVFRPMGKQYPLNGNRIPVKEGEPVIQQYPIVEGYAMTQGIPKEVWEIWKKQHQDSPLLENNLIVAYPEVKQVRDFAKDSDNRKLTSGLEPLSIKNDPRTPKKRVKGQVVDSLEIFEVTS